LLTSKLHNKYEKKQITYMHQNLTNQGSYNICWSLDCM